MSSRASLIFLCSHCDAEYSKWTGRCLECGQWGSVGVTPVATPDANTDSGGAGIHAGRAKEAYPAAQIVNLHDLNAASTPRLSTTLPELDRVLGGGLVPGSLVLLGGEPGIGKSTLALQLAAAAHGAIYFSAEESPAQIKLRADRVARPVAYGAGHGASLQLAAETNVEALVAAIRERKPTLAVVDSIQTIASPEIAGESGSVNQVRGSAVKLLATAKETGTPIVVIGHVTKDGTVAGPKTLEHLVDTVLYLEGERYHNYRLLRAVKNRFGSTGEVGMFEMTDGGMREVANPSAVFLASRGEPMPGSIVTCIIEGARPLLIEIQALVNKTVFGYPVRKASGFDLNRLHVLVAVLQKRAGLNLSQYDIHLNVVGGLSADEPAADLAVCLAIASSYKDKILGADLAAFGEVGLGGEVRAVGQTDKRLRECAALGLRRVITASGSKLHSESGVSIIEVKNIQELITHA